MKFSSEKTYIEFEDMHSEKNNASSSKKYITRN